MAGQVRRSIVRIRGSNSDQVLVLIDGAIMNSATIGNYDFANLTTDNIERIEILRGAQSMLWGADAMGGVINITTKKGVGGPLGKRLLRVRIVLVYSRRWAGYPGRKGQWISVLRFHVGTILDSRPSTIAGGHQKEMVITTGKASTKVGIELPYEGRLDLNFRFLQGKSNFDGGFGAGILTILGAYSRSQQYVYSGGISAADHELVDSGVDTVSPE